MDRVASHFLARTPTTHKITTHKYHVNANDHGCRRCPISTSSHGATATILHLQKGNSIYFTAILLLNFPEGWFFVGGPPTQLPKNQRYFALHGHRHGATATILHQKSGNDTCFMWLYRNIFPTDGSPSVPHLRISFIYMTINDHGRYRCPT